MKTKSTIRAEIRKLGKMKTKYIFTESARSAALMALQWVDENQVSPSASLEAVLKIYEARRKMAAEKDVQAK